ncbi:MAG: Gfo/Idh/MocA family oxidoreductase, partial [Planctomycetota bacterium]|nr:Gfo/Idh/MocA family oxidoreductase [Planctomycetota bacterium]
MNTHNFRVGIVGAVSSYSLLLARAFRDMPNVEFAGLAHLDRSPRYIKDSLNLPWLTQYPKTLEGYADEFRAEIFVTLNDMARAGQLDGVCICTEDSLHQHYAVEAAEMGIHVFVPKPFARSSEEARVMIDAANKSNVTLLAGLPHRFNPGSVTAQKVIQKGDIGRPISGHFSIAHHLSLGGWKSDPSMAAGPEFEFGFYVFDQMRMMMGSEPQTVMGLGANLDHQGIPYNDNGKCIVECVNGALASIDMIFSMHQHFPPAGRMHVIGDEGALATETEPNTGKVEVVVYSPEGTERHGVPVWDAHEREMGEWIRLCRTGGHAWWQQEALGT